MKTTNVMPSYHLRSTRTKMHTEFLQLKGLGVVIYASKGSSELPLITVKIDADQNFSILVVTKYTTTVILRLLLVTHGTISQMSFSTTILMIQYASLQNSMLPGSSLDIHNGSIGNGDTINIKDIISGAKNKK
ncbi:hypothetical protein ACJX0J_035769, partial [Zea mays]